MFAYGLAWSWSSEVLNIGEYQILQIAKTNLFSKIVEIVISVEVSMIISPV